MNTKWNRFLSLLLSIMLLVCAMPSMTMAETTNDDELTQAFTSELAPDVWVDQLDTPVAINDFCALMMRIIEPFDASLLPEWEKLAETALGSTREMKREDAMIAVYEAACLMGEGRDTTGDWVATDALLGKGDHSWELSNEYPEWHNLDDAAPFCTDCDQMIGGAYHFAQGQVSLASGKRVFDFDEDNKDLHMLDPLTKGEAILVLLRFSESLQKRNDAQTDFSLSEELMQKALSMPEASNTELPNWTGATIPNLCYFYRSAKETDVSDLAALGFTFARVPLAVLHILPEKTSTSYVDTTKLADVDHIIEWGIQYGVHICLDLHDTPGASAMEPSSNDNELYENEAYRAVMVQFWRMLAERYKEVPNNALSFNLFNEPSIEVSDETYSALMREVITAIREQSPERLIFVDMRGMEPTQGILDLGVAQAFHYYMPHALTHALFEGMGIDEQNRPNSGCEMCWPYPMVYNNIFEKPFTVYGDFHAGEIVEIGVDQVDVGRSDSRIKLDADGKNLFEQEFTEDDSIENGCLYVDNKGTKEATAHYDVKYTVTLTEDCQKLTLYNTGSCQWFSIYYVTVPNNGKQLMLRAQWFEGEEPSNPQTVLRVHSDGSVTNENKLSKYAFSVKQMQSKIDKLVKFSKKTGTPIMLQEFATHYQTPYQATLLYINDLLSVASQANIPWCAWDCADEFGFLSISGDYRRDGATYIQLRNNVCYDQGLVELYQAYMNSNHQ